MAKEDLAHESTGTFCAWRTRHIRISFREPPQSYIQEASERAHTRCAQVGPCWSCPLPIYQPDNAARLVRLGVARTIGSGSYTAARSVRDLQKLVTDPMYQTNADSIARIVKAEDGVGVACDALENCASV